MFKKGTEFLGDRASKAQTASHVKAQETRKRPSYFCSELSRKSSTEIHRPVNTQEPNVQQIDLRTFGSITIRPNRVSRAPRGKPEMVGDVRGRAAGAGPLLRPVRSRAARDARGELCYWAPLGPKRTLRRSPPFRFILAYSLVSSL